MGGTSDRWAIVFRSVLTTLTYAHRLQRSRDSYSLIASRYLSPYILTCYVCSLALRISPSLTLKHNQVLDHTSQIWWRWMNIFFTLVIWSVELLVSTGDDEAKEWKVD
jgi:hypothetical protein